MGRLRITVTYTMYEYLIDEILSTDHSIQIDTLMFQPIEEWFNEKVYAVVEQKLWEVNSRGGNAALDGITIQVWYVFLK